MTRLTTNQSIAAGAIALAIGAMGIAPAAAESAQRSAPKATRVELGQPEDIAFDTHGNMYVSEFSGHKVDRLSTAGRLTVIAGTGVEGFSGNGGPAVDTKLDAPTGLISEPNGSLLVADHHNGCIRRISPSGVISSIVGRCGHEGFSGDGGPSTQAKLNDPIGIAQDHFGNLYIADEQNHRLRKVDSHGIITTVAGGGTHPVEHAPNGMLGTNVWLRHPAYLVINRSGDVYLADFWANVVIRINRAGRITQIAGNGTAGFSGDGGPAVNAELDFPYGLALTKHGQLYISDSWNNRIREVTRHGVITTVAGTGTTGFSGDGGPGIQAELNAPAGIALRTDGTLVITDQANNVVRTLDRAGIINTVAGIAP